MSTDGETNVDTYHHSLRAGFDHFRTYGPWVNRGCYLLGAVVFITTYAIASRLVSGPTTDVGTNAILAATAITSVYFLVAFYLSIGSPFGNLAAPTVVLVGMPAFVYQTVTPGGTSDLLIDTIAFEEEILFPGMVVTVFLPAVLLGVVYWVHEDPVGWEMSVMPDGFGFVQVNGVDPSDVETAGWSDIGTTRAFWEAWGVLLAGTLLYAIASVFLQGSFGIDLRVSDFGGPLLVFAFLFGLHRSKTNPRDQSSVSGR